VPSSVGTDTDHYRHQKANHFDILLYHINKLETLWFAVMQLAVVSSFASPTAIGIYSTLDCYTSITTIAQNIPEVVVVFRNANQKNRSHTSEGGSSPVSDFCLIYLTKSVTVMIPTISLP
jgi:hypothetical protein